VLVSKVAPAVFVAPAIHANTHQLDAQVAAVKSTHADNLFPVASGACEAVSLLHIQATIERDLQNWL